MESLLDLSWEDTRNSIDSKIKSWRDIIVDEFDIFILWQSISQLIFSLRQFVGGPLLNCGIKITFSIYKFLLIIIFSLHVSKTIAVDGFAQDSLVVWIIFKLNACIIVGIFLWVSPADRDSDVALIGQSKSVDVVQGYILDQETMAGSIVIFLKTGVETVCQLGACLEVTNQSLVYSRRVSDLNDFSWNNHSINCDFGGIWIALTSLLSTYQG